jgi:hypothetical protein
VVVVRVAVPASITSCFYKVKSCAHCMDKSCSYSSKAGASIGMHNNQPQLKTHR